MYMADLADFVEERQVNFHSFADDTQTYLQCLPGDTDSVVCQLEGCVREIGHWSGCLPVVLSSIQIRPSLSGLVPGITWVYLEAVVLPSSLVTMWENRVIMFDFLVWLLWRTLKHAYQDKHVSDVCKTCFFWLRQLRRVCCSLDIESVKTLVHAFVT